MTKPTSITSTLYQDSEPIEIVFNESKSEDGSQQHGYTVTSPSQFAGRKMSVTTFLNILSKPELIPWAANATVKYIESTSRVQISESQTEYIVTLEELQAAKAAHRNRKEEAGELGSRIHDWLDSYLRGATLPYDDDMSAPVQNFLAWEDQHQPETIFNERIVYSKQHDFAGKLDWGGELNGRYGLIDFKTGGYDKQYNPKSRQYTGKIRPRTEHYLQNAGYDIALSEETGKRAQFYGVLYLRPNGELKYFETEEVDLMRQTFMDVLNLKRNWHLAKKVNEWRQD